MGGLMEEACQILQYLPVRFKQQDEQEYYPEMERIFETLRNEYAEQTAWPYRTDRLRTESTGTQSTLPRHQTLAATATPNQPFTALTPEACNLLHKTGIAPTGKICTKSCVFYKIYFIL
jgi:hypothetical protein